MYSSAFCRVYNEFGWNVYPEVFAAQLKNFKDNGFDCVNPSILKGTIQNDYPNFNERQLGCKRFSDLLKLLEQDGLCSIELDEQKTMRVRIL